MIVFHPRTGEPEAEQADLCESKAILVLVDREFQDTTEKPCLEKQNKQIQYIVLINRSVPQEANGQYF